MAVYDVLLHTLKELSLLSGISGQEGPVRAYILEKIGQKHPVTIDPLGNIILKVQGAKAPKNSLYFSAHMDEVGFIITRITEEGLLGFASVGGIDPRVVFGKSVEVGSKKIVGIVGGCPIHLTPKEEQTKPIPLDKLYIDIGAASKKEAETQVAIGDFAVFHAPFLPLGQHKVVGKAIDDRAGCALLLQLALEEKLPYHCTIAFTVQEETGCVGGKTAAYQAAPYYGVVVESTTASDISSVDTAMQVCYQGKGPVLSFMDRGAIYDHELYKEISQLATEKGIAYQAKEGVFGGNEAKVIQTAKLGTKVVGVSLPTRYLHSPSNTIDLRDLKETYKLLKELVSYLGNR